MLASKTRSRKGVPDEEIWGLARVSALVGVFVSAYFALILPLQTYLGYADAFDLTVGRVLAMQAVPFAMSSMAMSGALYLTGLGFRRAGCPAGVGHVALLAFSVSVMLESGVLSIGLPELDGNMTGYHSLSRSVWDGVVFLLPIAVGAVFRNWLSRQVLWMSFAFIVYAAATLADVRRPQRPRGHAGASCVSEVMFRQEVVRSVRYSPSDNVVLLILDSVSAEAAHDIFANDRELREKYGGFVNYTRNVGMHWSTATAIPSLMTGRYCPDGRSLVDFYPDRFASDSALATYLSMDIPSYVNFFESKARDGYSNRNCFRDVPAAKAELVVPPGDGRMEGLFGFTVNQMTVFRCLPYALKAPYLCRFERREAERDAVRAASSEGTGSAAADIRDLQFDAVLWPMLSICPVDASFGRTLQIHHSRAGHSPLRFDENGNSISVERPDYWHYVGACKHAFRQLGTMFDVWRTNGVYDASTIIVLADHASFFARKSSAKWKSAPSVAFPFMMAKARGRTEPFSESSLPTTHAHVADVLRTLASGPLSQAELERRLVDKRRKFRMIRDGCVEDYVFDDTGGFTRRTHADCEPDRRDLKPLSTGVEYSFAYASAGAGRYPDFIQTNGLRWAIPHGLLHAGNPMRIVFRCEEPDTALCAKFLARIRVPKGKDRARVRLDGGEWKEYEKDGTYEISVCDLRSDHDGFVSVAFECDAGKGTYDFLLWSVVFQRTERP